MPKKHFFVPLNRPLERNFFEYFSKKNVWHEIGTLLAHYWRKSTLAPQKRICYNIYSGKVYHEQRKEIYAAYKRTNTRNFENY